VNLPQRIVLAGAAIIIAGMILFPPWLFIYDPPKDYLYVHKTIRPAGYHLLFARHVAEDQTELARIFGLPPKDYDLQRLNWFSMVIDKDRLMIQLGGVLAITVLLVLLLKARK